MRKTRSKTDRDHIEYSQGVPMNASDVGSLAGLPTEAVYKVFKAIILAPRNGRTVEIHGFGQFRTSATRGGILANLPGREAVECVPHQVIRFGTSKVATRFLNSGSGDPL